MMRALRAAIASCAGVLALCLTTSLAVSEEKKEQPPPQKVDERKVASGDKGKGGERYALLVGISDYSSRRQSATRWHDLHGAEDVQAMAKALTDKGYALDILTDGQATRRKFLSALEKLAATVSPGARVVIYFSGHGGRIADDNGDEPDGKDEALILAAESEQSKDEANLIRDDELGRSIEQIRMQLMRTGKVDGEVVALIDSCYSGTVTRGLDGIISRGRPPLASRIKGAASSAIKIAKPESALDWGTLREDGVIVMTAGQSDEPVFEFLTPPAGIFSYYLSQRLSAATDQTTWRDLFEQIRWRVTASRPDQHPQLEGDPALMDRTVGSDAARKAGKYVPIDEIVANQIVLPIGYLHGATVGSQFALYPAGYKGGAGPDRACRGQCLGIAELVQVELARSHAKILTAIDAAKLAAGRAIEIGHTFGESEPLRICWRAPELDPHLLFRSSSDEVLLRSEPPNCDAVVETVQGTLYVLGGGDGPVLLRAPADLQKRPDLPVAIYRALVAKWRGRFLRALENTEAALPLRIRIAPADSPTTVERPDRLHWNAGNLVQLEVQHRAGPPMYLSLLELDPSGAIRLLFPDAEYAQGRQDHVIRPGNFWQPVGPKIRLSAGKHLWKGILTSAPVELSSVVFEPDLRAVGSEQHALQTVAEPMRPLARLLIGISAGTRSADPPRSAPGSFHTVQVEFTVDPGPLPQAAAELPSKG